MAPAERQVRSANRRFSRLVAVVLVLFATAGCVVDSPAIEATTGGAVASAVATQSPQSPTTVAQFEPTVTPAPPTPVATPTTEPTAEPTATSIPAGPTPLPTAVPADEFLPTTVAPGLVAVPVRGARFMLDLSRPVLQLGGHTLIYVDDERTAEVDIFIPAADRDGVALDSYDAVVAYLQSDPVFVGIQELTPVSIAGLPTRVFEGTAESTERAFVTELASTDLVFGWFPPVRMRLWLIDHPDGPVIVSAESLENPGRYSDAVRLATEVLSTIDFS